MPHVQALINPQNLVPLLQKLREIEGMPTITATDRCNSRGETETVLEVVVPQTLVPRVVETVRAGGEHIIVVSPDAPAS